MTTNITVYRKDLLPHNPCKEGLDWFDALVRSQGRKHSLVIRGQLGLLWLYANEESRGFAGWACGKGLLPSLRAPRADLAGADLPGADLSEAHLSEARLSRADLSLANLSGAGLSGANLSWADLSGANLFGANLSGADLSGANLSGANLFGANLSETNFSEADLSGADLYGAIRLPTDPPIPGWKVVDGRLRKE